MFKNEYSLSVDIKKSMSSIVPTFVQYDNAVLTFKIYDNGKLYDLTGFTKAEVYHKRPDGVVVLGEATIETINNEKIIRYTYVGNEMGKPGFVTTSLSIFSTDKKVSIQPFKVAIVGDNYDEFIGTLPEVSTLQNLITEVSSIVDQATKATAEATQAVTKANTALTNANEAITNANTAASSANTAATNANDKAGLANTAATNANTKASLAQEKANLADQAATSATTATTNANKATTDANTAKNNADTAATNANNAATNLLTTISNAETATTNANNAASSVEKAKTDAITATQNAIKATTDANDATSRANAEVQLLTTLKASVETAKDNAITATSNANTAATRANESATNLSTTISNAETATTNANNAASSVTQAKTDAITATQNANEATTNANNATSDVTRELSNLATLKTAVETAKDNAITATSNANTATTNANNATSNVNTAISNANTAATNAQTMADNVQHVGVFSLSTAYKKNNIVEDKGSSWMALQNTQNNPLPILPTKQNTWWRLVAQKGLDGEGSGTVTYVNSIEPDSSGNVTITASDIGAALSSHTHTTSEITGLDTALSSKYIKPANGIPSSDLTSAVQSSLNKADVHAATIATNTILGHVKPDGTTITIDANGVITAVDLSNGNAPIEHTHAMSEINGLSTALDTKANLISPTFTGTPSAPTATAGTNTTQIATTAFVTALGNTKANLASPTFTGTPSAPTATAGTNTTQIATTAYVTTAIANKTTITGNAGSATKLATARTINGVSFDGTANITIADSTKAPLASPALTGIPTAPTASPTTNTTQIATTAFVQDKITTLKNEGVSIVVSNTAPPSLPTGGIWYQVL